MIFILHDKAKLMHLFSTLSKPLHKLLYVLFFNAITTNEAVFFVVGQNECDYIKHGYI